MTAYGPEMSIRTLFAVLVAVAVLFAPALTRAGEAFAAVSDHHAQMMDSGHCKSTPSYADDEGKSSEKNKVAGKSCCMSMCMAVAIGPPAAPQSEVLHEAAATFPLIHRYHGNIAEIATPPPRLA